jgi:hypothetical protein
MRFALSMLARLEQFAEVILGAQSGKLFGHRNMN